MKDVLIIKPKMFLSASMCEHLRNSVLEQMKDKVVILPGFMEAELISIPDDVEVIIESEEPNGEL